MSVLSGKDLTTAYVSGILSTAQHSTAQHSTAQHSTAQHSSRSALFFCTII